MAKRSELSVGGRFVANIFGLLINAVLFKWALDSFLTHANWGEAFWASYFLTGLEVEISKIKELVSK